MEHDAQPLRNSKANIIKAVIVVILFIGCLFLLWRERLNQPVQKEANTNVVEESTLVVKTIKESTPYTDINAQIPQFTNTGSLFNRKIETFMRERIAEHKQEAMENWQARFDTQAETDDLPLTPIDQNDRMYFYAKFDVPKQNNNEYISLLTRFGGYTGGAHGYEDIVAYNFDVKNKQEIYLADLFKNDPDYLNKISSTSRDILVERFTKDLSGSFDSLDEELDYINNTIKVMVYDGTNPANPDNFANFTFTKDKLFIHFGQYQVAPYVVGLQDIEMPLLLSL